MRLFTDEVIVVTGSSGGIGKATAILAAREGAVGVVVNGRRQRETEAVAAEIRSLGVSSEAFVADLTDITQPAKLIDFTVEKFGRIDGVVNNMGVSDRSDIFNLTAEELQRMISINVTPAVLVTQAAIRAFRQLQLSGSIVVNGSMNSYVAQRNLVAYGMTKGALMNFIQTLGHDLAVRHAEGLAGTGEKIPWIRLNGIGTPWTNSEKETAYKRQETPNAPDDWFMTPPLSGVPRGTMTSVEEVAGHLLFLLSSKCNHVNGQYWPVEQFNLAGPPNRELK